MPENQDNSVDTENTQADVETTETVVAAAEKTAETTAEDR